MTTFDVLTDVMIRSRIGQHDDPDHPDAVTVEQVREQLARINSDIVDWWPGHLDVVDDGGYEIVFEDRERLVVADHTGHFWREQFDALDIDDDVLRRILLSVHHDLAGEHTDYSWSASNPVVVEKPPEWQAGEAHVERRVGQLAAAADVASSRAFDYWGSELRGHGPSRWAALMHKSQPTVSDAKSAVLDGLPR